MAAIACPVCQACDGGPEKKLTKECITRLHLFHQIQTHTRLMSSRNSRWVREAATSCCSFCHNWSLLKINPEDNLGGRRNEVNETSLEVINCVPPAVHCCSSHHRRHPLLANSGLLDDLRLHRLFVGGVVSNIVYRFTSDAAQASLYGVQ